jgi:gamma-glutamylcyclotransferase (GGCT)/AIG2-like uncharacterized protein YtfP
VSEYLFTYGTLRPGLAPAQIAAAVAKLRVIGLARVRGVLYDFGEYPGAVPDAGALTEIEGTVYELPEDAEVLRRLDAYEDFDPEAPESSLFVREMYTVKMDSGSAQKCWIYVYNRDPAGAKEISHP